MKSSYLSQEQIEYIREMYGYKRTSSLAKELSVSPKYVQRIASKLGIVDLQNKYYIEGNIAHILCVDTNDNQVYFQVDKEDLERVVSYAKWFLKRSKNKLYVVCNKEVEGKRTTVRLHRFLLNFPEQDVDHIDGNSLNNIKSNLRLCTKSQNMSNLVKCRADSSTGCLNVSYIKKKNRFRPELVVNGIYISLGLTTTIEEAELRVKYARANYLEYSQEFFNKEYINTSTPQEIKEHVDNIVKRKLGNYEH